MYRAGHNTVATAKTVTLQGVNTLLATTIFRSQTGATTKQVAVVSNKEDVSVA